MLERFKALCRSLFLCVEIRKKQKNLGVRFCPYTQILSVILLQMDAATATFFNRISSAFLDHFQAKRRQVRGYQIFLA